MKNLAICVILIVSMWSDIRVTASDNQDFYIPEGKLVMAHYMTNMVPGSAGERIWASPELYNPLGSTSSLGGLYLTLPMWSILKPDLTLEQAVDFEMSTAQKMGVDGFQFYYPFINPPDRLRHYNKIIQSFIRVADQKYPDFKIALCLSLGGQDHNLSEDQRIDIWGTVVKELLAETADSPSWLRNREGSLVFFHWVNDGFADGIQHLAETPEQVALLANAFNKFSNHLGHPIDWVFHVRKITSDLQYIESILNHFPAVWGWVKSDEHPEFWDYLAEQCHRQGVAYTQTVYPDYFTSKVYPRGDQNYQLLSPEEAIDAGPENIERHYRQTDLARGQINLLESAIRRNAVMINYATWNDWPEGQHLAPELNHNFGPSLILRHYKAKWRGEQEPFDQLAILFLKRHHHRNQPHYPIGISVKSPRNDPAAEDKPQLVTILNERAKIFINGQFQGSAMPGLRIKSLRSLKDSPINIELKHHLSGETLIDFTSPIGMTRTPKRLNRLTFSYSNRFDDEMANIFGPGYQWPPKSINWD